VGRVCPVTKCQRRSRTIKAGGVLVIAIEPEGWGIAYGEGATVLVESRWWGGWCVGGMGGLLGSRFARQAVELCAPQPWRPA